MSFCMSATQSQCHRHLLRWRPAETVCFPNAPQATGANCWVPLTRVGPSAAPAKSSLNDGVPARGGKMEGEGYRGRPMSALPGGDVHFQCVHRRGGSEPVILPQLIWPQPCISQTHNLSENHEGFAKQGESLRENVWNSKKYPGSEQAAVSG
jgi:hypothetical protein